MEHASDTLDAETDETLNELFAAEVEGWRWIDPGDWCWLVGGTTSVYRRTVPDYCDQVDLVLPHLSRLSPDWSSRTVHGGTVIRLPFVGKHPWVSVRGDADTFARAGVIAAIRATRAIAATQATSPSP